MLRAVLEIVSKVCAMLCHLMFTDSRKDVDQIVTVALKISFAPSRVSVSRSGETADTGEDHTSPRLRLNPPILI